METALPARARVLCGHGREAADKSLPVHVATRSPNSHRLLLEEIKKPAWRKHLVITCIKQVGAWRERMGGGAQERVQSRSCISRLSQ